MAGAGLAATPFLAGLAAYAAADSHEPGVRAVRAYGARSATGPIEALEITRRAVAPHDVRLDVMYSGICHSDIHTVRADFGAPSYPIVPGHEIIGRVTEVGNAVTSLRVGDIAGVGCMVDSCGTCVNCLADREQNCVNGTTFTYNAPDLVSGGYTFGGYSQTLVVTEKFAIRIPPGVDLAGATPLLCAGITTFSPMQHWQLAARQKVGIIGVGGLGHVASKLAAARGADVTLFTTTPRKLGDAQRLGAREAVLSTDAAAMSGLNNQFDLLISTVPQAYPMQPFMDLIKLDRTLVNVGALNNLADTQLSGMAMVMGRKSLAGSMIGGIAETQQMIDYCAQRGITADVELIRPDQINAAYQRILDKDIRYRFVIDFT
ncbi:NAD(P)-dependent alcohol dehydrogenase [Mycobacterium sp. NPDC006124]|uniref:NAD(P)-dependent alcohol dehydrogenase n=1 Tax=Mycobacterium sp. NPDC006124 TaxID=3156729 RepID=UPI0033B43DCA